MTHCIRIPQEQIHQCVYNNIYSILENKMCNSNATKLVLPMLIFDVGLPTADVYSDSSLVIGSFISIITMSQLL